MNAGVLLFDGAGRIRNTNALPTEFNAGIPTNGGLLCWLNSGPQHYLGGLGFASDGRLCCADGGDTIEFYAQGAMPIVSSDRLAVLPNDPIAGYNAGLPVTPSGRLVFATVE